MATVLEILLKTKYEGTGADSVKKTVDEVKRSMAELGTTEARLDIDTSGITDGAEEAKSRIVSLKKKIDDLSATAGIKGIIDPSYFDIPELPFDAISANSKTLAQDLRQVNQELETLHATASIGAEFKIGTLGGANEALEKIRRLRQEVGDLDKLRPKARVKVIIMDQDIQKLEERIEQMEAEAGKELQIELSTGKALNNIRNLEGAIDSLAGPLEMLRELQQTGISPSAMDIDAGITDLVDGLETATEGVNGLKEAAASGIHVGIDDQELQEAIQKGEALVEQIEVVLAIMQRLEEGVDIDLGTDQAKQELATLQAELEKETAALNGMEEAMRIDAPPPIDMPDYGATYEEGIEGAREFAQYSRGVANALKEEARAAHAAGESETAQRYRQEANAAAGLAKEVERLGRLTHSEIVQEFGKGAETMDELKQKLQEATRHFRELGKSLTPQEVEAKEFYNNLAKNIDKSRKSLELLDDELNDVTDLQKKFGKFDEAFKDVRNVQQAKDKLEELRDAAVEARDAAFRIQDVGESREGVFSASEDIKELEDLDRAIFGTESHFKFLGQEAKGLGKIIAHPFNQLGFAMFVTTSTFRNFSMIIDAIKEQFTAMSTHVTTMKALNKAAKDFGMSITEVKHEISAASIGLLDLKSAMQGVVSLANEGVGQYAAFNSTLIQGAEAIELMTAGETTAEDAYDAFTEAIETADAAVLSSIPGMKDIATFMEISTLRAEEYGDEIDTFERRSMIVHEMVVAIGDLVEETSGLKGAAEDVSVYSASFADLKNAITGVASAGLIGILRNIDEATGMFAASNPELASAANNFLKAMAMFQEGGGKVANTDTMMIAAASALRVLDDAGADEIAKEMEELAAAIGEVSRLEKAGAPFDEIAAAQSRLAEEASDVDIVIAANDALIKSFGEATSAEERRAQQLQQNNPFDEFFRTAETWAILGGGAARLIDETFFGLTKGVFAASASVLEGSMNIAEGFDLIDKSIEANQAGGIDRLSGSLAEMYERYGISTIAVLESEAAFDQWGTTFSSATSAIDLDTIKGVSGILAHMNWILSDASQLGLDVAEAWDTWKEKLDDLKDTLDEGLLEAADERNEKLLEAQEDYFEDLEDAFNDSADKLQDIEDDLATKIRHIQEDADDKEIDKKKDHDKKMLKIEDDYQKKIDDIMRKYEIARIKALIDRDARALFEAQLNRDEDLKKANDDAAEKRKDAKKKLDDELKDMAAAEAKKIRRAREAAEERRQDALDAYDDQKADIEESYADQQETINEAYDEQKKAAIENFEDQKKAATKARKEQETDLKKNFEEQAKMEAAQNIKQRITQSSEFATNRDLYKLFYKDLLDDYGMFWDDYIAAGAAGLGSSAPGTLLWWMQNAGGSGAPDPNDPFGVNPSTSPYQPPSSTPGGGGGGGVNVPPAGPCGNEAQSDHMDHTPTTGEPCGGRIAKRGYRAPDCSLWECWYGYWHPYGQAPDSGGTQSTGGRASSTQPSGGTTSNPFAPGTISAPTGGGTIPVVIQTNDPTLNAILQSISYDAFAQIVGGGN